MVRTQISFERNEYRRAQRVAARRGVSLAELCRRGLREAIERENGAAGADSRGRPWMRHAGALSSGDPHASESVDTVVSGRSEP
jgi:hypothetical protein